MTTVLDRRPFYKELERRGIGNLMRGLTFYHDWNGKWFLCPSCIDSIYFEGSIEDALISDKISDELKVFIINNLDVFI